MAQNRPFADVVFAVSTFFAGAEESEDPISLEKQTWKSVKEIIQQKVREYLV